jgi:FkbM family methyltransferase
VWRRVRGQSVAAARAVFIDVTPASPPSRSVRWLLAMLRAVPMQRGKVRLARRLLARHQGAIALTGAHGLRWELPDPNESIALAIAAHGHYERETVALLKQWIGHDGVLVDVGANIGAVAIPTLHDRPNARGLLIEAVPRLADTLLTNLARNEIRNATVACCLCGERSGVTAAFWDAPATQFGRGSRAPQFQREPTAHFPLQTLDALVVEHRFSRLDALKVDVEGYEKEVFLGARDTLARLRPKIAFEFMAWCERRRPDRDIGAGQQALLDQGYRIYTRASWAAAGAPIRSPVRDGDVDFVALPRD